MAVTARSTSTGFFNSRRGRVLKENLTAYFFLLPAGILMFVFGIFPVAFAFFVSLHRWRRFPDEYIGLANYERAIGNLGYIFFFWIAVGSFLYALYLIRKVWKKTTEDGNRRHLAFIIPGVLNTAAILLLFNWFFMLLPVVMDIPRRIRGLETTLDVFMNELGLSLTQPEIYSAGNLMLVMMIVAFVVSMFSLRVLHSNHSLFYLLQCTAIPLLLAAAYLVMQLTLSEIQLAIAEAQEAGESLPIWSQLIFLSIGGLMMVAAYFVWRLGIKSLNDKKFIIYTIAGILLAAGGFLIMADLPEALASADDDLMSGFAVTLLYVIGTVPVQLAIGLALAYVLFQNIRGRALFRMIFFIPYITPFVATAIVFKLIFSAKNTSFANQALATLGIAPQQWLLERNTIGELLLGANVPDWIAGPSLALIVIMIFSTWTYIGYDAVLFLAGLGNIPTELYEAARIDGANGWRIFRHITFPLLSPTTFFLTLIAVIGTFKAFTQIWIMRTPAAGPTVDTASVYIFTELHSSSRYGYASAMAFILFAVILALTLFQSRLLGRKVFYG